jgi:putative DNA primase/helicase
MITTENDSNPEPSAAAYVALHMAQTFGWKVLPIHCITRRMQCSCQKGAHCKSPGKHPLTRDGVHGASSDLNVIRAWVSHWPEANWAVACGEASGIVVIDIDPRHGGYISIQEYEENRPDGPLPRTLQSSTGGGGRHLLYRYPDDGEPVPGRNPWLRGVDVKSDGGYVVLPGSNHISGGSYAWADSSAPITKMPTDVLQSIRSRSSSDGARGGPPDTDDILDGVPEGERDETLFRLACRLRRQLGDNARKAVEYLILKAANECTPPFPEAEALRKVEQAFKQDHGDVAIWDWLGVHPCNDRGNAGRFVDKHHEVIRYVPSHDRWYVWNGSYWVHDRSDTQIIRLAQDVEHILRQEAEFMPDQSTRNKMLKFAERAGDTARITAFLKQAKADLRIQATYEQFDGNPYELACPNGVVDLTTGHVKPVATESGLPSHWCTKLVPYEYDPDAKSELWEATLKRLFVDGELVELFRLFVGYSITGVSTEEKSLWMYGDTGNGKSTVLTAIRNALGPELVVLEGDWQPSRLVVLEFEDLAAARRTELIPIRTRRAHARARTRAGDCTGTHESGSNHRPMKPDRAVISK